MHLGAGASFSMRAYITIVGADMIGRAKLMHTMGNRCYSYCEYCSARGIWNGSIYCPFTPPADAPDEAKNRPGSEYPWATLNPTQLPLRKDNLFRATARHIAKDMCDSCQKKHGIRGPTILQQLRSLDFPRSFPPDLMHLMYENVVPALFRHFRGVFFSSNVKRRSTVSGKNDWTVVGNAFEDSAGFYPFAFGDPLRNFTRHCHELKAAEWAIVTKQAAPIFLKTLLPEEDYNGFLYLVDAITLLEKPSLTRTEQKQIGSLLNSFSHYYEARFYCKQWDRLRVCLPTFHQLLHMKDAIVDLGPAYVFWQWPMER
ncbi:hypothetical protein FN846DRAFT_770669 [Sphaerosporella brunnea]|uniref:Uncharacterized protein n=1 Tax=Sphaerosporella brunnea TaxID=1250544 RepID=A0A5J5FB61_9PEZI|nr:hypothetical protein FN846DRAFT_770669 [Sphaerosporella brunnea]